MSEDPRKVCRTQGKYSERNTYEDKKYEKRPDRRVRESPTVTEPQELGRYSERNSYEDKRYQKRQDRRVRESPTVTEPQELGKNGEQNTYEDKRYQKRPDRRVRENPTVNEPQELRKCSDQNAYEDKIYQKRQDRRVRESSTVNGSQEKKNYKRRSDGGRTSNTSLTGESEHVVRYEENSGHTFPQLEEVKKPVEIRNPGKRVLSSTDNGESVIHYYPRFCTEYESAEFMERLQNTTNWYEKNIVVHGKEFPQPRLVAWYGPFPYTYSGATLEPADMPDIVLEIKEKVERLLVKEGINVELNSVLLNLYRDNKDSVAWHSDDELTMGVCPTIASVSFGETRKFEMRRILKESADESSPLRNADYFIRLTNGSLLIMDGCMQKDWQHRVPKEYHDRSVRINLTFRTVYSLEDLSPSRGAYPRNPICSSDLKSCTMKTDNGVSYDEENFPPLNSDFRSYSNKTNNGVREDSHFNSDARSSYSNVKTSLESDGSMERRTGYHMNKSANRRSSEGLSYHKTSLKSKSELSQSHDTEHYVNYEDENSLPLNSNSSSVWSNVRASSESNDPRYDFNAPHKRRNSEDLSYHKTSLKNSSEISESCDAVESLSNPLFVCKIFPESENDHTTQVFPGKAPVKMHDKINESERFWDCETSSSNDTVLIDNDVLITQQATESCFIEKNAILNNLNENKNNAKVDIQNKNLYDYNSDFLSNNVASSSPNGNEDQNFHTKEINHTYSVNNIQENAQLLKSETACDENRKSTLNVRAREFVPQSLNTISSETRYDQFELENLVSYNADLMDGVSLKTYAFCLKAKVLEKMSEIIPTCREELEFLCELTDGDQTEKNQKLICVRICSIVFRALKRLQSPNYRKPHGTYRGKFNHGNQNRFAGRYQYNNREGPFRH